MNGEKTKYMVMSRDQNAGQDLNIKIVIMYFEQSVQFKKTSW